METSELPQGHGVRHRSAAGTTSLTDSIVMVISEPNGDIRIFRCDTLFMEIEKRKR
ncbi:MAG: DNA integrity scanning protein DisA nucleotide-binding domain protein [Deltaproteobacteria bacterium]|nr:DNA integrity scanning protein DisA nucleotide-binding domain protein [Deltaproteobacteria bacterium]